MDRWLEDRKGEDWRAWAVVASWAAVRARKRVGPEDYFPYLSDKKPGGDEMLFAVIGEEEPGDPETEDDGERDGT